MREKELALIWTINGIKFQYLASPAAAASSSVEARTELMNRVLLASAPCVLEAGQQDGKSRGCSCRSKLRLLLLLVLLVVACVSASHVDRHRQTHAERRAAMLVNPTPKRGQEISEPLSPLPGMQSLWLHALESLLIPPVAATCLHPIRRECGDVCV